MYRIRMSLLLGCLLVAILPAVQADDPPVEEPPPAPPSKASTGAEELHAAFTLAHYGINNKVPEAMIVAARVIGTTKLREFELAEGTTDAADKFDGKKLAMELIDGALRLDNVSDPVKQLAEETRKLVGGADDPGDTKEKGAVQGPQVRYGTVSSGDKVDTFAIRFRGGEQAMVMVNNRSNRGDIDLYVQDDNGRTVARDRRADDDAAVSWWVPKTQTYYIKVKYYRGQGKLRYTLTTN